MSAADLLKKHKLIAVALAAYLIVLFYDQTVFTEAVGITWTYLREMLEVLPPVFILSTLITVWVPRDLITTGFGTKSGLRGRLMSLLIGSLSAGPIYAAFPLAASLLAKGASVANIVTIISAWAVVKLPMLIVETRFLGLGFALTRYLLTVPIIFVMAELVSRWVPRTSVLQDSTLPMQSSRRESLRRALPGSNCGACGFGDCEQLVDALLHGDAEPGDCAIIDQEGLNTIASLMHVD